LKRRVTGAFAGVLSGRENARAYLETETQATGGKTAFRAIYFLPCAIGKRDHIPAVFVVTPWRAGVAVEPAGAAKKLRVIISVRKDWQVVCDLSMAKLAPKGCHPAIERIGDSLTHLR